MGWNCEKKLGKKSHEPVLCKWSQKKQLKNLGTVIELNGKDLHLTE